MIKSSQKKIILRCQNITFISSLSSGLRFRTSKQYLVQEKKKQTHKLMEHNREPRNKPIYIQINSYLTREPRILNGEKTVSSINDTGKIGYSDVK